MAGRPKRQIAQAESVSEMKTLLLMEGEVFLQRVGLFSLKRMPPRKVPNRWNDELKDVGERIKICFRPDRAWLEHVNA